MMQKGIEGLLPGGAQQRGLLLRVWLLPELGVQSLASLGYIARREEIFQMRISEYQHSVLMRLEGDRRSVRPLDHVGGEEVGHARHVIVRAHSPNHANALCVLRPVCRQKRQSSGKANAHYPHAWLLHLLCQSLG